MKIGIDARPLSGDRPTGIGIYLHNIISYINQFDTTNEYILYSNKPINLRFSPNKNITTKVTDGKIGTFWLRYKLPRQIKKDMLDIFWGTEHFLPKSVKGVQSILTVHDLSLLINPSWGTKRNAFFQNIYAPKSIREAGKIIAVSESTKKDIIEKIHIPSDIITVVYNGGSSIQAASKFEGTLNIEEKFGIKGKFFLYLGTLEPRKNVETLIDAFDLIASQHDVSLVVAGGLGWKYEPLLAKIENLKSKIRIIRTGYIGVEDKVALFKQAQAVVYPSLYEGFGIPVLEALENGVPVITTRNSSLPEVGGSVALYIDNAKDFEALASQMINVLNLSREEREKLIQDGYKQAKKFSWEKCAKETLEVICGK